MATIFVVDDCGNLVSLTGETAHEYLTNPKSSLHDLIIPCAQCGGTLLTEFSHSLKDLEGWDESDSACFACYRQLSNI